MPRTTLIVIQIGLVVAIALVVFGIVDKHRQSADLSIAAPSSEKAGPANKTEPTRSLGLAHYRFIDQRNLFQVPSDDAEAAPEIDLSALKQTELKLKLWGTITGPEQVKRAIVEDTKERRQVILREKDTVASASIKMILRDKVVLEVNGEDQILEMEKVTSAGGRRPVRPAGLSSPARPRPVATTDGPMEDKAPRPPVQIRIRPSLLKQLAETPDNWDRFAVVSPYQDEEGNNGLMVNRVTPASPLRRLGIRNGDILLTIDGEPVGAMDEMMAYFQEAAPGDEMAMELKRRGKVREMNYVFQ
jgi:general secretion pathway protein C